MIKDKATIAFSAMLLFLTLSMAVTVMFMRAVNGELTAKLSAAKQDLVHTQRVNSENGFEIVRLAEDLGNCVLRQRIDRDANIRLEAILARQQAEYEERVRNLPVVRQEIYREPSCAELGDLDLFAACPAVAGRLRENTERRY